MCCPGYAEMTFHRCDPTTDRHGPFMVPGMGFQPTWTYVHWISIRRRRGVLSPSTVSGELLDSNRSSNLLGWILISCCFSPQFPYTGFQVRGRYTVPLPHVLPMVTQIEPQGGTWHAPAVPFPLSREKSTLACRGKQRERFSIFSLSHWTWWDSPQLRCRPIGSRGSRKRDSL